MPYFTPTEYQSICESPESNTALGKRYGVHRSVIWGIRERLKYFGSGLPRNPIPKVFTVEEEASIALDTRPYRPICRQWGISERRLRDIRKRHKEKVAAEEARADDIALANLWLEPTSDDSQSEVSIEALERKVLEARLDLIEGLLRRLGAKVGLD